MLGCYQLLIMSGFLTDNYQAGKRNKVLEILLFILMFFQVIVMGLSLMSLANLNLAADVRAKEIVRFLPIWTAGLIPVLVSRINFPISEAKRQILLIILLPITLLLLLGVTIFSWEVLKISWQYL